MPLKKYINQIMNIHENIKLNIFNIIFWLQTNYRIEKYIAGIFVAL